MKKIKNTFQVVTMMSCFLFVLSSFVWNENTDNISNLDNIEPAKEWTAFKTVGDVEIEYMFSPCESKEIYNETMVLFKFQNTSNKDLTLRWTTEIWRDNECTNCNETDGEYTYVLNLRANETIAGNCDERNPALQVFGNFTKLGPGMSDQHVTDIKFTNLQIFPWK